MQKFLSLSVGKSLWLLSNMTDHPAQTLGLRARYSEMFLDSFLEWISSTLKSDNFPCYYKKQRHMPRMPNNHFTRPFWGYQFLTIVSLEQRTPETIQIEVGSHKRSSETLFWLRPMMPPTCNKHTSFLSELARPMPRWNSEKSHLTLDVYAWSNLACNHKVHSKSACIGDLS